MVWVAFVVQAFPVGHMGQGVRMDLVGPSFPSFLGLLLDPLDLVAPLVLGGQVDQESSVVVEEQQQVCKDWRRPHIPFALQVGV